MSRLKRNLPFFGSGIALSALCSPRLNALPLIALCAAVLFFICARTEDIRRSLKQSFSVRNALLPAVILLMLWRSCFWQLGRSAALGALAAEKALYGAMPLVISLLLAAAAAYSLLAVVLFLVSAIRKSDAAQGNGSAKGARAPLSPSVIMLAAISAAAAITLCSKSSPLYPFNDWVDSNCFLTVGKSMLRGLVPYRDLYEQKGPLLYMLHAAAACVSERSFFGVYLLEIAAAFAFLCIAYKTMRFVRETVPLWQIPALAALVYSSCSFCHGDSAEELCLPLFALAVFEALKTVKTGRRPSAPECIALGGAAATALWIKYTMIGPFIGAYAVFTVLLLKRKAGGKLIPVILWSAFGAAALTAPILAYFAANGALKELWTVYFYNNLFYYKKGSDSFVLFSTARNLASGVKSAIDAGCIQLLIIAFGLLTLRKSGRRECRTLLLMLLLTAASTYVGGRDYPYYSLIFAAFLPPCAAALGPVLSGALSKKLHCRRVKRLPRFGKTALAGLLCAVLAFSMCANIWMLRYRKADLPQYRFAETINKTEGAELLNYGFLDGGFYTAAGIVPSCRFFCELNIDLEEMRTAQAEYVDSGKADFIVTRDKPLRSDKYALIDRAVFSFEGEDRTYYLYRRIPS